MTTRSYRTIVVLLLACAVIAAIGLYLGSGSALLYAEASPDGRERLEVYQPMRWQRLLGQRYDHDHAYVRLTRATDGTVIGTSPVFYLNGAGKTSWTSDRVDIGAAATFNRATKQWRINEGVK